MAEPFIKWVGGKRRLLPELRARLPKVIDDYHEPFLGGGALFFDLTPRNAYLSDTNKQLIKTYRAVRDNVEYVISLLDELSSTHNRNKYYDIRKWYNKWCNDDESIAGKFAAAFIYLNKTCFNGLYRVNKKGAFNVPIGRYTNPKILDADALRTASKTLNRAYLSVSSFEYAIAERACSQSFFYLDPPYVPVSDTANFTAYAKTGFSQEDQRELANKLLHLDGMGAKFMLSNSDTPFTRQLYKKYNVETVQVGRGINSDPSKRGAVSELIVRNYD